VYLDTPDGPVTLSSVVITGHIPNWCWSDVFLEMSHTFVYVPDGYRDVR
jgi:hypothetical protein